MTLHSADAQADDGADDRAPACPSFGPRCAACRGTAMQGDDACIVCTRRAEIEFHAWRPAAKGCRVKTLLDTPVVRTPASDPCVGARVPVGEFFWIPNDDLVGHDKDARHGHDCYDGGSVDIGCTLTIRAIQNSYALVRLDRPKLPYGASAAIGAVFQIPLAKMQRWPDLLATRAEAERQRRELARRYCR
ncbi:MAG: hypothetical protein AAFU61_08130 [Pseudomonadota bacterium]